ncbi:MAG: putative amidohydrolase [Verrucomicrobiales bacterium]|jgi:predicted amidohydrolase
MRVIGGDPRSNLLRAARMTTEAAAGGADIIVFPEAMDLGWTHHSASELAEPIPDGSTFEYLADLAEENAIYLCAGITERDGDHIYNCAVLIDRTGKLLIKHRKINELQFAQKIYTPGDAPPRVCATEFGLIGVMICADALIGENTISHELGGQHARFVLSPCAWAIPPDHDEDAATYSEQWIDAYLPIAKRYELWIAAVSNVGKIRSSEWAGHHCIGSSMLASPDGNLRTILPFGRDAEAIELIDISTVL